MQKVEINQGYLNYLRPAAAAASQPWGIASSRWGRALERAATAVVQPLSLLGLFAATAILLPFLHLTNWLNRRPIGELHANGLKRVDTFVDQYPFHLYPVFVKALELDFLLKEIARVTTPTSKIVELAIGDGSLSKNIYPPGATIVAVELSPFSLQVSSTMPHVRRSAVSDCTNPAVASGAFDLLVTNNFLHHVTDKEAVLDHIARISERAIFNENTTYWTSSWPRPFLLGRLGLKAAEARETDRLARKFLQDLRPKKEIDAIISERFTIEAEDGYLCEKTLFLCGIFSRLMGAYGPATPGYVKRAARSALLGGAIRACTRALVSALIRFDSHQDKEKAISISYSCRSRSFKRADAASEFVCAECRANLPPDLKCSSCGAEFPSVRGMAFLLPKSLQFIHERYVTETADVYETESVHEHH